MIISFAKTTPALLNGSKTVTRRGWCDTHAAKFHKGDIVDAYDKSPRYRGKKVATIRITKDPYKQALSDMPDDHFEREGGLQLWPRGIAEFQLMMGSMDKIYWVVEFELVYRVCCPVDGGGV